MTGTITTWADGPMLALDTETTGTDPETARIVTATTVRIQPGQPPDITEWLVNPGIDIPAEATAVHGITTEKARTEGVNPATACLEILDHLHDAWNTNIPVVIMNASYDLTVLDRELRRHTDRTLNITGHVIDPMVIDRATDKYRPGKRTLTDLCRHYRVTLDGAHTASGDALACARVAWRIAHDRPDIGALALADLHGRQVEWRRRWAVDFTAHLRKTGKADVVDGSWPVRVPA